MVGQINKAVLFDLDGTLLDTLGDLTNAVNYLLRKYGFPERCSEEIRSYLGNGARELVRLALPERVSEEELDRYLEEYKIYYNAHSKIETKPYDGIIDLLKRLRARGIRTAVVSNKPDLATRILCDEYFGELIDFALGDKADIKRKPDAAPVRFAMEKLNCSAAVYVGDSEVDVMTAKNAGIPCISVTWGFRDRDFLAEREAEFFADDVKELEKYALTLLETEEKDASKGI